MVTWYLWNMVAIHHDVARRCPWMHFPFMIGRESPYEVIARISVNDIKDAADKFREIVRITTGYDI